MGVFSKAQPHHIPLTPVLCPSPKVGLHPSLELQTGLWSWPSLPPGWGEAEETGDNLVFPIAKFPQKSARSERQQGALPRTSSERGGTSACPPCPSACCCAELDIPKRCSGQLRSPLPGSAPRPCHCREEPQRWFR